MAPIRKRPSLRARASQTVKSSRGAYAPPTHSTDASPAEASPAALHTAPSSTLKRTSDSAFGFSDDFKVNKKDKRTIKHNQLLARVQDEGARVGKQKKELKRRRPGKKLVGGDLGGLADALPDTTLSAGSEEGEEEGWEGLSDEDGDGAAMEGVQGLRKSKRRRRVPAAAGEGKMAMKSLRHRPGAMKRKRRMEQGEMERFGRNLAQMVGREEAQQTVSAGISNAGQRDRKSGESEESNRRGEGVGGTSQADRWAALRRFIGGTMEKDKAFGTVK